jgi:cyclopropane fatty-acyl-phospholipid synthase-like methyltransferase
MSYQWDIQDKRGYNNRMGRYRFTNEFEFIKKHIAPGKKVLDIGGGSGRFAIPLMELGYDVTVVDKSSDALEILQNRSRAIKCINSDFMNAEIDDQYDNLIAIEVIYYFDNYSAFFKKVSGLMKKGGKCILMVENPNSPRYYFRKIKKNILDIYHPEQISRLKLLLEQTGLKIEAVNGFNWVPLSVSSDSILVDAFAKIESTLGLGKIKSISPLLMYSLVK